MDLYRYISFEEFMTLVTFKTLHFVKPTKWDDSYEGCAYQMMADETFRNDFFSHLYDKMTEKDIFIKLKRRVCYQIIATLYLQAEIGMASVGHILKVKVMRFGVFIHTIRSPLESSHRQK